MSTKKPERKLPLTEQERHALLLVVVLFLIGLATRLVRLFAG